MIPPNSHVKVNNRNTRGNGRSSLAQDEIIKVGDLVHVMADNCDLGLGFVIMIETDLSYAYRVLTIDGRCLFYHPFELSLTTS